MVFGRVIYGIGMVTTSECVDPTCTDGTMCVDTDAVRDLDLVYGEFVALFYERVPGNEGKI